jgi:tRNA G37 N-methylase Trm5
MKLKEILRDKLSDKELSLVPTSFDVVGSILIFSDFSKELVKKEKLIANTLLSRLKNVKTVCKKTKKYSGRFRTPTLKIIGGENTKETIHKENSISLKLDVEKVYFSGRTSNERLRISKLVKKGEEILVMFSGCSPLPCVLSKNTPAKYIYGIEINKTAHNYATQNIKLNKLSNVFVINKDVRKTLPNFYQNIIGLKSSIKKKEIDSRLIYRPNIMEIHTFFEDFEKNFTKFKNSISKLIKQGYKVIVHQPFCSERNFDMIYCNAFNPIFQKMISLIKEFGVELVIHANSYKEDRVDKDQIYNNIKTFKKYYNNIYFENGNIGFFSKRDDILDLIKQTKIKNVCIDTCHLLHFYNSKKIIGIIKEIQKYCNTYFHLSDFKDNIHGKKLNKDSLINLKEVLPLINKGVVEVKSKDEVKANEMISSYKYLSNFNKTFDRILMPLPKSAKDYLDLVFSVSKKGTVVHFYDFLHEKDFELCEEKIKKACKKHKKKYKILNFVKCGQYAPKTYRVCLDFKIL